MKNTEAKILEKTYLDRMTVTRKQPVIDEKSGETLLNDITVYEGAACGLSQSGASGVTAPSKDSGHNRYTQSDNYTIFAMPKVLCQAGDRAVVVTSAGQTFRGITGKSFAYSSHSETAFKIEKVV